MLFMRSACLKEVLTISYSLIIMWTGFGGASAVLLRGCLRDTGRLSPRSEFTPVPSCGSIFVYMIPPQISCWRESPQREFTPVLVPGQEFHSSAKSRNGIM